MSFIEMKGITKIYPGTIACNKVNVTFNRGEVHTMLGENGAGKTTLMKVLPSCRGTTTRPVLRAPSGASTW